MEIIVKALRISSADFFLVDPDAFCSPDSYFQLFIFHSLLCFLNRTKENAKFWQSGFTRKKWPEYVEKNYHRKENFKNSLIESDLPI